MLKVIASLAFVGAASAQATNTACTATQTHQAVVDFLAAINAVRSENGTAESDQTALPLAVELSTIAANKLTDIAATCTTDVGYGFTTGFTTPCCPGSSMLDGTNQDTRQSCVNHANAGPPTGDTTRNIAVSSAVPAGGLTLANMKAFADTLINTDTDFAFLKTNTNPLMQIGVVFDTTNVVITVSETSTGYNPCAAGTPSPTTTSTAAVTGTTTASGTTTAATTRPSGATSVGVGMASLAAGAALLNM